MSLVRIRRATREDAPVFLSLVHELAAYEKMAGPTSEAETRLLEDGFGARPRFDVYLAEDDQGASAYALVFETYSSFRAEPVLYMEDLFVSPRARRTGVATEMMRFLAAEAERRGCGRMLWQVLDWNVDARAFYERLGATYFSQWVTMAVQDEALEALAEPSRTR